MPLALFLRTKSIFFLGAFPTPQTFSPPRAHNHGRRSVSGRASRSSMAFGQLEGRCRR